MKSLAKNSVVNAVYMVLDFAFVLIRAVYVGRILLADGVGRVSYVQSIAGYFLALAQLGLPDYGIREIAKARETQSGRSLVFAELFVINLLSTTAALLAYLAAASQIAGVEQIPLFFVFGLNIFFNYFNIDWLYRGQEEYVYIAVRSMAVKLLSLIAIFSFVRAREDYVTYALICCLETGGNYALNMMRLGRFVKPAKKKPALRRHVKPLLFLAAGTVCTTLYSQVDITMLGILSSKTATGYYSYANTAIWALTTMCIVVLSIFLPRLSYYYHKSREQFYELLQLGMRVQAFISFPISAGVFILAPQIVTVLFGGAFFAAATTVRILAILIAVKSFSHLVGYQMLLATGNEKEQIPAFLAALMINAALNRFLIPVWANNGAAVASVISEAFVGSYEVCRIYRRIHFKIPWRAFGQAFISTVLMALVMVGMVRTEWAPLWQCAAAAAGGAGVYIAVNLALKNQLILAAFDEVKKWKRSAS